MAGPDLEPSQSTGGRAASVRRVGTAHMVVGTIVAALAAYLFQVIGGRALGAEDFAPISVLWTMQFLVYTVLFTPLEQLIIRRLALAGGDAAAVRPVLPLLLGVVGLGTVGAVAYQVVTLDGNFLGDWEFALIGFMLFTVYGLFAIARGFLAGRRRFREYGLVIGSEGVVRLIVAVIVILAFPGPVALAWSMITGAWVVLVTRPFRHVDSAPVEAPVDHGSAGGFLSGLFLGNAASQTILAGGPIVVAALGGGAAEVSTFFATFTLFRGPLTMSYAFLGRVLPPLTNLAARGEDALLWRWSRRLVIGGLVLAGVTAVAGYVIGPQVVVLLFGQEFEPARSVAALGAGGVVAGGMAFFVGQVLVAQGRTTRFAAVWLTALVSAASAIIAGTGSASLRVAIGFAVGQVVALVLSAAATRHIAGEAHIPPEVPVDMPLIGEPG